MRLQITINRNNIILSALVGLSFLGLDPTLVETSQPSIPLVFGS
jgi:hypothetical protein